MGQISSKLRNGVGGRLYYWCQGCEAMHCVVVEGGGAWGYNGNAEAPTFTPSVLTTWDGYSAANQEKAAAFHQQHGRYPTREELPDDVHNVCHTFITNGMVQFLGDCTHALAGQTWPLPDLPEHARDAS